MGEIYTFKAVFSVSMAHVDKGGILMAVIRGKHGVHRCEASFGGSVGMELGSR